MALENEKEFYKQHRDEWLPRHEGKVAVIKGEELIGVFDTIEDAYEEAVRRLGNELFLIARILNGARADGPLLAGGSVSSVSASPR